MQSPTREDRNLRKPQGTEAQQMHNSNPVGNALVNRPELGSDTDTVL